MERIFEQDGLRSRVIVGDGSAATYYDRGLVDAGVVEVLDFSMRDWPMTVLEQLCSGWWPDTKDLRDHTAPLVKPRPEDLLKLGVWAGEGLAVAAKYIMGDMKGGLAEQASRGIKIGQDSPVLATDALMDPKTGQIIKGSGPGSTFGGNPMAHFGFAQKRMEANIERTKMFPGLVIWTTHERGAQDKISQEKVVGPEVIGEALTANIQRAFNDTLHFVTASNVKDKEKDAHTEKMITDLDVEFRIYTRDHFHPDGTSFVKYKATTRGGIPAYDPKTAPDGMPLYLTSDVPGRSILDFYDILTRHKNLRAERIRESRPTELAVAVDEAIKAA
jgi:hypothetical protein